MSFVLRLTKMADDILNLEDGFKKIHVSKKPLPITRYKNQIIEVVRNNQIVIICGETGSGKSTQIPQYILESGIHNGRVIGVTEPRRIAAVNMAMRVCEEIGCPLGYEVGYEIRFRKRFSNCTKIKFMTDGILLNQCLLNPELADYSVIMIDEAHERSIDTDVLLGLLKSIAKHRKDLKILITSATININKFKQFFDNAPAIRFPGDMYDVEIIYRPIYCDVHGSIKQIVQEIHKKSVKGGILIFLTGQEEIDECCEHLQFIPGIQVFPLYGAMEYDEQQKIFQTIDESLRKVIVATNIAETSITIDDIQFVVDFGYVKQMQYDTKSKIQSLTNVRISKAQADQRKGRAGRTAIGWCYRLYDKEAYSRFDEDTIPAIYRENLSSTFLRLASNEVDPMTFNFIDSPKLDILKDSSIELKDLGFVDSLRKITPLGRKMRDLPVEPKIGKVLLTSMDFNCTMNVIIILSMLTEKNVFIRSKKVRSRSDANKKKFFDADGDHFMLRTVFNKWVESGRSSSWCTENYINFKTLEEIDSVQKQLIELVTSKNMYLEPTTALVSKENIKKALISGFYKNIARQRSKRVYTNIWNGEPLYMHPSSCLMNTSPKLILFNEVIRTTKPFMREMIAVDEELLINFPSEIAKINYPGSESPFFEKSNNCRNWIRDPYYEGDDNNILHL